MKKLNIILFLVLISIINIGCTGHTPDAGYEVVFVEKPYFFGAGGVVMDDCGTTGLYWTAISTDGTMINVKPIKKTETFDDLITKDNNPVDFSITLTLAVKKKDGEKCYTPIIVKDLGENWYANKMRPPIGDFVRQFTKKQLMFSMTTDPVVTDNLKKSLKIFAIKFTKDENIPVDILDVTIGKVTPPASILAETIATGKQIQRKKTEAARADAEGSRETAEIAKAKSDQAYMSGLNMTPKEYIELRKVENERLLYEKLPENLNGSNIYIGANPQPVISNK